MRTLLILPNGEEKNYYVQIQLNSNAIELNSIQVKNSFKLVIAPGVLSPAVSKGGPSEIKC
jgi:hypothetical protein